MIIAVDLDGTLTNEREYTSDSKPTPNKRAIERVNAIYDAGNDKIIIYTARPSSLGKITQKWLKSNEVKYHRLVMDKLLADIYIDDRARADFPPFLEHAKGPDRKEIPVYIDE